MKKLITILAFFALSLSFGQVVPANVFKIKNITSVQRDGLTINAGEFPIIYNSTTAQFERWNGAAWVTWSSDAVSGVSSVNGETGAVNLDLGLTGNTLSLTGDGTTVDLSGYLDNTDTQDLSFVGTTLSLTNGGSVNLSSLQDGTGTDSQTLSFTSPNLSISGGNSVNLSALQDGTGTDDQTASEVNIADAGGLITATTVEGALQENRTAINLNTAKVTNAAHTGEVTGATALTIASGVVDSDNIANGTIDEVDLDASVNASLDLADSSVQPGDIDTFAELNAIVADKSLANLNDAQTFSSNIDFGAGIDVTGNITATGTITGSNLSGTNTGDQTITLTGDVTGSGTGSFATTIAAGAVDASKIESTNAATDGYFPSYDSATGGVTWEAISTTDSGSGYSFNSVATDNIYIRNAQVTNGGEATARKIWNQFTVTADSVWLHKDSVSLTGNPFILQPWGADSVVVRKGAATNFYIADSAAALSADGIVIKGRHPITAIKTAATDFFLQGNFTTFNNPIVAGYNGQNAIDPVNEVNGVNAITTENGTVVSSTDYANNGTYSAKFTANSTTTGRLFIQTSGISIGDSITFSFYVYRDSATDPSGNIFAGALSADGWDTNSLLTIDNTTVGSWVQVTGTRTATVANPPVRVYATTIANGNIWYVDNVTITKN